MKTKQEALTVKLMLVLQLIMFLPVAVFAEGAMNGHISAGQLPVSSVCGGPLATARIFLPILMPAAPTVLDGLTVESTLPTMARSTSLTLPGTDGLQEEAAGVELWETTASEVNSRHLSIIPYEYPSAKMRRSSTAVLEGSIAGQVTDASTGEALPGVNVIIAGTATGAATDIDGRYIIQGVAPGTYSLQASFIGYQTRSISGVEVRDGQVTTLNIQLGQEGVNLDEVVVVGYGTQQRRDLTGSIAAVSAQNIENLPITTLDQAIQGQVAGVQVQQTSGVPGGGLNILVRGMGSIGAGNQPLYVIDGMPVEQDFDKEVNAIGGLNPNDIESIQILKDASASAIYGSRGSNGVVLISTKRGREGAPRIQIDSFVGSQEVANRVDVMDPYLLTQSLVDARNYAYLYAAWKRGITASVNDPNNTRSKVSSGDYVDNYIVPELYADILANPQNYRFTDWQDVIFRQAGIQSTNISASGGSGRANYYLSGSFLNQDGVVIGSGFRRYSFRLNTDVALSSAVKVGVNISPSYAQHEMSNQEGSLSNNVIGNSHTILPLIPAYCSDEKAIERACPDAATGQVYGDQLTWGWGTARQNSPLAEAIATTDDLTRFRTLGNAYVDIRLLEGLNLRSNFGADIQNNRYHLYRPSFLDRGRSGPSRGSSEMTEVYNLLTENTLNFNRVMAQKHSVSAVGGFTVQKNRFDRTAVNAGQFPNDLVQTLNAGVVNGGGSYASEWGLVSYLARVNYTFDDKYLFSASVRKDGSSRFGEENKWGTFPSVSAGWRLSREAFMKSAPLISDLKLRASWGMTGNFDIGNYSHIARLTQANYAFGPGTGSLVNGVRPTGLSNVDLGWEKTSEYDLGLDIGLFNDRLYFTADYYDSRTSDLLLNVPIPEIIGYSSALTNIGKVANKGWEFAVNTKYALGPLTWSSDFNVAFNRNEVLALGPEGDPIITGNFKTEIGKPIGNFYGYVYDGLFNSWQEVNEYTSKVKYPSGADPWPGDVRFVDVNGDGKLDPDDRTIIGNNQPDFIYGWTNNFYFKNFDLRVVMQGVQGSRVLLENDFMIQNRGQFGQLALVEGYWRAKNPDDVANWAPENPGATHWRPFRDSFLMDYKISSYYVFDASFLRINNITLGYRLPRHLVQNVKLQNARIYIMVQNPFTFTDYKWGYNPEVNHRGADPLRPGADIGSYPIARSYSLGLSLGL